MNAKNSRWDDVYASVTRIPRLSTGQYFYEYKLIYNGHEIVQRRPFNNPVTFQRTLQAMVDAMDARIKVQRLYDEEQLAFPAPGQPDSRWHDVWACVNKSVIDDVDCYIFRLEAGGVKTTYTMTKAGFEKAPPNAHKELFDVMVDTIDSALNS